MGAKNCVKKTPEPLSEIVFSGRLTGSVWVETSGAAGMEHYEIPDIDERHIKNLAQQVAASSHQAVSGEKPLLSAALPSGERIQIILPPCAPNGGAVSIRKQLVSAFCSIGFKNSKLPRSFGTTCQASESPIEIFSICS